MNRIRSIKPELRRDRKIADCGILASLLSRDLITYADDQGRFRADPREVKAECFPYHDTLKAQSVEDALQALAGIGLIELYEVGGDRFGWMPRWFRDQRLQGDRMTWSELPPPPSFRPDSMPPAILRAWLKAAEDGLLPETGDARLAGDSDSNLVPNRVQGGSGTDTAGNQPGSTPEPARVHSGPRARASSSGEERRGVTEEEPPYPPRPVENSPPASSGPDLAPGVRARSMLLLEGCSEILARPLTVEERDLVQGWATKKRGGEYPPVEEILDRARAEMARGDGDGNPAYSLKWASNGVSTVFRAPSAGPPRPERTNGRAEPPPRHVIPAEDMAAMQAAMTRRPTA